MSEITITHAGERPGRPPLVRLLVDVRVSNTSGANLWVLIPRKLPVEGGGIDKLEQLTAGSAVYGRFLGTGGFYAAQLAPGAKLTVKNLELSWWSEEGAKPPAIDVRTGTGVTAGGTDLAAWFDKPPAISGSVEIDADKASHTYSKKSDNDAEVEVAVQGLETKSISIAR